MKRIFALIIVLALMGGGISGCFWFNPYSNGQNN